MALLKFTRKFLNTLDFENVANEQQFEVDLIFDEFVQSNTKLFLFNKQSFYEVGQEEELKAEIEETYKDLAKILLVEFDEALRLTASKEMTKTRTLTQNYGDETNESSTFEPKDNGVSEEEKQAKTTTNWQPDTTTETETDNETSGFDAMRDFFKNAKETISATFLQFINIYY